MLYQVIALAAALQAAAASPPRTLQDLPGVKLHSYVVTGNNGEAIQKSMGAAMKAQPTTVGQLFAWTAKIDVSRDAVGAVCTIKSAKATLDANVYLPQLADETKVSGQDLQQWKTYAAGIQAEAANNLWFVADRLPTIERSLVGKSCDQAGTIWNDGITALTAQQQAFDAANDKAKPKTKKSGPDFNKPTGDAGDRFGRY